MSLNVCRCCMARPPDKDLKAQYTRRGKNVVYGDMLKECFDIEIFLDETDDGGICELCEMKLSDANDFKHQVQRCQKDMQKFAATTNAASVPAPIKVETVSSIKLETNEDHDDDDDDEVNDIYFLDVKDESDFEMREDDDDDKNLAELFPESVKKDKKKPTVSKKKDDKNLTGVSSSGLKKSQPVKPKVINSNLKIKMNIDNIIKYSNATPFFTKNSSGIVCYCIKSFDNVEDLKIHLNDAHKDKMVTELRKIEAEHLSFKVDITDLACAICDKDFNVISSLKRHLIKDHNIKFHSDVKDYFCEFKLTSDEVNSCALCDGTYDSFLMLVQHMHSHYSNYFCTVCKGGFINSQALKFHQRKHLSENKKQITESMKFKMASKSDCKKIKYNLENILKYSNCTPFINQSVAGIACPFCDSCFDKIQDLKTHITEIHYKEDDYMDKYKKLTHTDSLVVKIDITDLACTICDTNFNYISELKEHLIKEHAVIFFKDVNDYIVEFKLTSNEIFTCVFCNSKYETFKSMLQHLSIHYNNYFCEVCGASFINKNSRRNHSNNLHGTTSYECSVCSKAFSNKAAKVNHENLVHKKRAKFHTKCPFCDATFTDYYHRNRHLFNEHNTKAATYKCNVCDDTFFMKVELTRHIKRKHLMEKNHVCSYCENRFFDKRSLNDHLAVHERSKIYQCGVCSKAYSRMKTLRAHMHIHNDKRFKCGICYSEFHHKVSLKGHMLSKHKKVEYEFFETVVEEDGN